MIDPSADRAVYRQVADVLRAKIRAGELTAGDALPPEARLAYEYGVGRDSVRAALQLLVAEGLVETRRGATARVREPVEVTVIDVDPDCEISARMPTPEEQRTEGIPPGVPMLVIHDRGVGFAYRADRHTLRFRTGQS